MAQSMVCSPFQVVAVVKFQLLKELGRCFTIVNREEAPFGYYDMDVDDYPDGSRADDQQNFLIATYKRIQVPPANQYLAIC